MDLFIALKRGGRCSCRAHARDVTIATRGAAVPRGGEERGPVRFPTRTIGGAACVRNASKSPRLTACPNPAGTVHGGGGWGGSRCGVGAAHHGVAAAKVQ